MENKIYELYKEAKVNCKIFKSENYSSYNDFDETEENLEYIGEVSNQIHDKIQAIAFTDRKEYENLISLLIIHYYTVIAGNGDYEEDLDNADEEEYEEIYDELIEDIINCNKEDLLNSIENQENNYLYELIEFLISEELQYHEDDDGDLIEDYDDFSYMEDTLKRKEGLEIYKKFHPNLNLELQFLEYQLKKDNLSEKLKNIKIKNLTDFFYVFDLIKKELSSIIYINYVLRGILYKINDNNLLDKIKEILLTYYYVYQKNNSEDFNEKFFFDVEVKYAYDTSRDFISAYDYIIKYFCNFDMTDYYNLLNNLSEEEKLKLNLTKKN